MQASNSRYALIYNFKSVTRGLNEELVGHRGREVRLLNVSHVTCRNFQDFESLWYVLFRKMNVSSKNMVLVSDNLGNYGAWNGTKIDQRIRVRFRVRSRVRTTRINSAY